MVHGLRHMTLKNRGILLNISPELVKIKTSNLVYCFIWASITKQVNNFPEKGHGLGHVALKNLSLEIQIWYAALSGQLPESRQIIFMKMGVA